MTLKPGVRLIVLDSEENRANNFWKPFIGKPVLVVHIGPDGLLTVIDAQQTMILPADGVRPTRFEAEVDPYQHIGESLKAPPRPWWRRLGHFLGLLIDRLV